MCIVRASHHRNYTCISNEVLRDERISLKARGLLSLLLSYPDNWKVRVEHLINQSDKDGRTSILSAIAELEEFGYIFREQVRDEKGQFKGWETVVREVPSELVPVDGSSAIGFSDCGLTENGKPNPIINNEISNYPDRQLLTFSPTPQSHTTNVGYETSPPVTQEEGEVKELVEEKEIEPVAQVITNNSRTPPPSPTLMTKDSRTPLTHEELAGARSQLRAIRINPDECMWAVCKYWSNFQNAILYVTDALSKWKRVDSPVGLLIAALKDGRRSEKQVSFRSEVNPPPSQDILDRIKDKFHRLIQMPWGDSGECWGTYINNTAIPWWEAIKLIT